MSGRTATGAVEYIPQQMQSVLIVPFPSVEDPLRQSGHRWTDSRISDSIKETKPGQTLLASARVTSLKIKTV